MAAVRKIFSGVMTKPSILGAFDLQFHAGEKMITRSGADSLIPVEISKEIIQGIPQYSTIMGIATKAPNMSTKQRRIPVLSSLPTAYFVDGDVGLKQTSDQLWSNKFFEAEELAVIIPIPEAVLDDAEYDIWAEVKPRIMEAMGIAFDNAVLFGTNAPASWPLDILSGATAAGTTIALGTGTDIYDDTLGEDGLFSLIENRGFMVTGSIAHMSMKGKYRGLRDLQGNPIFKTSMQDSTKYELDGAPIQFPLNGAMDATKALQFSGDFKQVLYTMRQDITYKILDQAVISDSAGKVIMNLAQQDMVALRAVIRLAWQIPNPLNSIQGIEASRYPISILTPTAI